MSNVPKTAKTLLHRSNPGGCCGPIHVDLWPVRGDRRVPKPGLYLSNPRDPGALPHLVGFVSPPERRCTQFHFPQGKTGGGTVLTFSRPVIFPVISEYGMNWESILGGSLSDVCTHFNCEYVPVTFQYYMACTPAAPAVRLAI